MVKRLAGDREIIIPIGVAAFSIAGILCIALIFFIRKPQAEIPAEATLTPFKFQFLGAFTSTEEPTTAAQSHKDKTSTVPATLAIEASHSASQAVTSTPQPQSVIVGTSTSTSASSTLSTTSTPGGSGATKTPASTASSPTATPSKTGATTTPASSTSSPTVTPRRTGTATTSSTIKIDDFDDFILYDGGWIGETVDTAYEGTLSISIFIDDTATFTFTGTQFIIGYVPDPQLGTMTITIDGNNQTLNQSTGSEWSSPKLSPGEHSVTLTHATGEIIYLDYITLIGSP